MTSFKSTLLKVCIMLLLFGALICIHTAQRVTSWFHEFHSHSTFIDHSDTIYAKFLMHACVWMIVIVFTNTSWCFYWRQKIYYFFGNLKLCKVLKYVHILCCFLLFLCASIEAEYILMNCINSSPTCAWASYTCFGPPQPYCRQNWSLKSVHAWCG